MRDFYRQLIYSRFFPAVLILLAGGYVFAFFNLFYFGRLPLLDEIRLQRYPLLDTSRNYIDQKNFIVNIQPLRNYLSQLDQQLGPNKMTVYVEFLNTGANISINQDLRAWPASLAKLPLAMEVFKKVEQGELKWSQELIIGSDDQDPRSGNLYKTLPDTSLTLYQVIKALLVDSDNTAQHMLLKIVNSNDIQELIDATGLQDLADVNGKISAKEYTRFFRALYYSSFLTPEDSQKILVLLNDASFKDYLSQGVPSGTTFSHKYGEDLDHHIYIDSGIVYLPGRPYMITLMLQNMDKDQAKKVMKDVSANAREYFSKY